MANAAIARNSEIIGQLQRIIENTKHSVERSAALLQKAASIRSPLCCPASGPQPVAPMEYGDSVAPFPFTEEDAAGFYVWDIQADTVYGDRAIGDIFDFRAHSIGAGLPMMLLLQKIHVDDRSAVARAIYASLTSSTPFQIAYRVRNRWGEMRVVAHGRCFRQQDGEPLYWGGIVYRDFD